MRVRNENRRLGFMGSLAICTTALLTLTVTAQVASKLLGAAAWQPSEVALQIPGWIGLFLPFAAFVSGLAGHAVLSAGSVAKRAAVITAVSYLFLAYLSPMAEYHEFASRDADMTALYPFGPLTPKGLVEQRAAIHANPPEVFSFRINQPLTLPPNWLTYLLHSSIVTAAFSILAGLLGHRSGKLTSGLSPPNRRNARLALGLLISIGFFVAEAAGGEWVRADPSKSGALGAWLPLVVPLTMLGVLEALLRRRANNQRTSAGP